jgi:NTP pyrophosphatase (non-canonical NTP hydrolase)
MYRNLEIEILRWAEARQIIPNSSTEKQLLKCVEELGELVGATLKGNREAQIDGFGDVLVTLILAADLAGLDLVSCLQRAYEEIKDRKGTLTKEGIFGKNEAWRMVCHSVGDVLSGGDFSGAIRHPRADD